MGAAAESRGRRGPAAADAREPDGTPAAEVQAQPKRARRRQATVASLRAEASQGTTGATRRKASRRVDGPAVARCDDLARLRALGPDAARRHVDDYLRAVMTAREADDFEALGFRWELHLVELDQVQLVRTVDVNRRKLAHYRAVLRKDGAFPPLIGLGGERGRATHDVLLLDGYHRALAMRDVGLCFAWMWLATETWSPLAAEPVACAGRGRV